MSPPADHPIVEGIQLRPRMLLRSRTRLLLVHPMVNMLLLLDLPIRTVAPRIPQVYSPAPALVLLAVMVMASLRPLGFPTMAPMIRLL